MAGDQTSSYGTSEVRDDVNPETKLRTISEGQMERTMREGGNYSGRKRTSSLAAQDYLS